MFSVSSWSFKSSLPFKKENTVYFQGRNINEDKENYEKNAKELIELFQNVIWITYRKNFPALLNDVEIKDKKMSDYISDTGWGCMVRVGQMAFAEALRRHILQNNKLIVKKKEDLSCIIQGFYDDDSKSADIAPYSIQKISKRAYSEFSLLPGEWYTPIRICYILGLLHNEIKCIPLANDLKVAVFSSSRPIVFEDFLERMCKVDPTKGKHASLCGPECRAIQNSDKNRLVCPQHHELEFSLVVYIVCMIGLDTPQSEYLQLALKMMDSKFSFGLIGGKPKKALYFLGRVDDDLIYLDPHYVQEFTNQNNIQKSSQYSSYFCKKFQTYPSKNIDSSFSLMFYLKDLEQLEEFYQYMMDLKKEYNEHFFMMMEDKESDFSNGEESNSSNLLSQKNLIKQSENQNKRREKEERKNQPNFDDIEDVDKEYATNKNSKYNDKSNKDQNNKCDDDDDFEVI